MWSSRVKKHLHAGGPALFSKVLEFAENEDWQGLSDWKNSRRWKTIRMSETTPVDTKAMPVVVRLLPPSSVSYTQTKCWSCDTATI